MTLVIRPTLSRQQGATMIEVLVAVLIFLIGLLGIASTQTLGLTNTQSSLSRNYASQLAYQVMDIFRYNSTLLTSVTAADFLTTARQLDGVVIAEQASCQAAATGCSSSLLAQDSLYHWSTAVAANLPGGQARLSSDGTTVTVTLTWEDVKAALESDARDSAYNNAAEQDRITAVDGTVAANIFSYSLSFIP